jgi:predicted DNA-binding transcriptional regulator AlpA
MNGFLTMTLAADKVGVSKQYIWQLIKAEKLQAVWMLGRWAVPESEVKRLKRERSKSSSNGHK